MKYSQILRNMREDNDKTQAEIADAIKISRATYNRMENNHYGAKFEDMIELAKYWNVSLDYLAGLTREPKPLFKNPEATPNKTINITNKGGNNKFNIKQ